MVYIMTTRIAINLRMLLLLAAGWIAVSVPMLAQKTEMLHATGPLPSFDVATIKEVDPKNPGMFEVYAPGTHDEAHFGGLVRNFIAQAYRGGGPNLKDRINGGPDWIDKTRYRIVAKIPEDIFAQMQKMVQDDRDNTQSLMLQSLLAERFKLKVHFERRELPAYDLVLAKDGPKLPPPVDPTPGPVDPTSKYPPANMSSGMAFNPKTGQLKAVNMPLEGLFVAQWFGMEPRIVVNKTGLMGKYSLKLDLGPPPSDAAASPVGDGGMPLPGGANETSIFSAVQEQLGLKLVPSKAQVEVLVIDSIELPSEN